MAEEGIEAAIVVGIRPERDGQAMQCTGDSQLEALEFDEAVPAHGEHPVVGAVLDLGHTNAAKLNMDLIRSTASYSAQSASTEYDIANQNAMNGLTPVIKGLTDKTAALMKEYPDFTKWTVLGTAGLTALAGAAGAAALSSGMLARAGGGTGAVAGAGAGALGGGVGSIALSGLKLLGAGAVGYGIGTMISNGIEGTAAGDGLGELIARTLSLFGNQEAAQAVAVNDAIKNSKVGGDLTIHVQTSDPSVAVQNEARPFNGTRMRVNTGRSNPEGSW